MALSSARPREVEGAQVKRRVQSHDYLDDTVDRGGQHGLCGASVVARLSHDSDRLITFACLMAGVAIEAAKNNQNAEATEVLRQSEGASAAIRRAP